MILINYWAVLAAAVAAFVFGSIWFMPLFGKTYMKYIGSLSAATDRGLQFSQGGGLVTKFLSMLVQMYVLAILLALAHPATWVNAAAFGFMVSAAFSAVPLMNDVVFERKPLRIFGLQAGYEVIGTMIAAIVLFYW